MIHTNYFFEENKGQIKYPDNKPASEAKYIYRQGNLKIFLLDDGLIYQLEKYEQDSLTQLSESLGLSESFLQTYRMDMELVGANPNPEIIAEGKSNDYTNYYQPDLIQTFNYQKIIYKNIYPGIDWIVYISDKPQPNSLSSGEGRGEVKYDFIVHPGADPSQIKIKYKHAEQIYLDQFGNLILRNRLGDIKEDAPISFQDKKNIAVKFILKENVLSFHIKSYNHNQVLVIDPKLEWSTYYGGTNRDEGRGCILDSSNNIYLYGHSMSNTGIANGGFQNIFIGSNFCFFLVKFNSQGIRKWSTYFGSNNIITAGKIDKKNNVILLGYTSNNLNNYAHNAHQNSHAGGINDGLIVKFDSLGNRIWSSYYGGIGDEQMSSCVIDKNNNIYISGSTTSDTAIAANGYRDSFYLKYITASSIFSNNFIVKFNENGVRIWGTYYGIGNSGVIQHLSIDENYLYFTNVFQDTNYLFTHSYSAANLFTKIFIAKFSHNGQRILAKPVLLGYPISQLYGIYKYDTFIYALTNVNSTSSPTLATGFKKNITGGDDILVSQFDTSFNLVWSSYCGGNQSEFHPSNLSFDKLGNFYIAGRTNSSNGIFYRGLDSTLTGLNDIFITKISNAGHLIWSSYYGGEGFEAFPSILTDFNNNIFVSGFTNSTTSISYQGHQNTFGGSLSDAFLSKLSCNQYDTILDTICYGDSLLYRGKYYTQLGFYTDTLLTWDICDSFISLHLTVLRKDTIYLYDTICSGTNYVWNGVNRTASGVYRDTLINNVGCDSFLILNLHIKLTDTTHVYDTSCNNLPKTFNNQNLTLAGIYRDTLKNIAGCDSHIFYHFIPKPAYETPISRAICANDSSLFGGKYYKKAGDYYDTLKTIRNCDSVIKLTLTVHKLDTTYQTQPLCKGETFNFYSQIISVPGNYSHKHRNRNGCDSFILLTLSIRDTSSRTIVHSLCDGQFIRFNNQNLTQAGLYRDTFTNYLGCDSFVTLNLSFGLVLYDTLRQTVCAGQVFRGYSSPGTYYETYRSSPGCDSILTIYLKHLPATDYKTISHNKCGAFVYGSRTYTKNDSFTETIKNYLNCDSIVTKLLVFITEPQPKFLADKTIEFCEEIMHKGQLKTTNFFTQDTIKSLEFPYCDSLYQPYYYRRESRPVLTAISKQIDTVIKGETTNIQVRGAQNYRWMTGEQNPTIRPQISEDKTFEVTAWNLADCEEKMQFNIYAIDKPLIDFPTAFSPNGDGLNDYFTPNLSGNISIDYFQIFNRWGEKVYEHSPLSKGWDGSYLGKPASNGLYTYTLRYSYLGRNFTISGEVMVF